MDDEGSETQPGRLNCIDPPEEVLLVVGSHGGQAMGLAITPLGLPPGSPKSLSG